MNGEHGVSAASDQTKIVLRSQSASYIDLDRTVYESTHQSNASTIEPSVLQTPENITKEHIPLKRIRDARAR
jgi:hypothetical protein